MLSAGLTPKLDLLAHQLTKEGDGGHENEDFGSTASCPFDPRAGHSSPDGFS